MTASTNAKKKKGFNFDDARAGKSNGKSPLSRGEDARRVETDPHKLLLQTLRNDAFGRAAAKGERKAKQPQQRALAQNPQRTPTSAEGGAKKLPLRKSATVASTTPGNKINARGDAPMQAKGYFRTEDVLQEQGGEMDELGLFIPTMTTISMCESNEEEEEKEYVRTVEIIDRIYTHEDKNELARGEVTPLKRSRQGLETQSARQKAGGHSER